MKKDNINDLIRKSHLKWTNPSHSIFTFLPLNFFGNCWVYILWGTSSVQILTGQFIAVKFYRKYLPICIFKNYY